MNTVLTGERKKDNFILYLMALGAVIFHIALNGHYGFHRDELDFIMNARQLDWGYVSYPPITPLFARIGLELFGESLRGLRVLPAIAQGVAMILAALMARDMGGQTQCADPHRFRCLHRAPVAVWRHGHHVLRLRLSLVGAGCVLHGSPACHR